MHGGGSGGGVVFSPTITSPLIPLDPISGEDEFEYPDYFSLNGCYFIICGQVVRDYYNNWYWGVGPGLSSGPSVSLSAGTLIQPGRSEEAIQNFTLESTVFAGGVFPLAGPLGLGPAVSWGDPSLTRPFDYHDLSIEVQVGNVGAAGGYLYDFWIYDSGDPTPWFWQDNDGVNNLNP